MGPAALQAMKEAPEALIAALDANGVDAIGTAIGAFNCSLSDLKAAEPEGDPAAVQSRADELARLSEHAQIRVNFLTDLVRRRLERLATARGQAPAAVYSRTGM